MSFSCLSHNFLGSKFPLSFVSVDVIPSDKKRKKQRGGKRERREEKRNERERDERERGGSEEGLGYKTLTLVLW